MMHRISQGQSVRMLFNDAIDTSKELVFEIEENGHLELALILTGSIEQLSVVIHLVGSNALAQVNGLYVVNDQKKFTLNTQQMHHAMHSTSAMNIKGILFGHSQSQYESMIHIAPQAYYSQAKQSNKNMLMSSYARAQAKPSLQVLTKDVQCAHGSATGNFDQEVLWYMQSRGLGAEQAEQLLLQGFIADIVQLFEPETAQYVNDLIQRKAMKTKDY